MRERWSERGGEEGKTESVGEGNSMCVRERVSVREREVCMHVCALL